MKFTVVIFGYDETGPVGLYEGDHLILWDSSPRMEKELIGVFFAFDHIGLKYSKRQLFIKSEHWDDDLPPPSLQTVLDRYPVDPW